MLRQLAFRSLVVVAVILLGSGAVLWLGAATSLDWARRHTVATDGLPPFQPGAAGLVRVATGELVFRARLAGPARAPNKLVLLHGFPETSAMWLPLMHSAAAAGYRVLAFDQRGYSPGARPEDPAQYTLDKLAADVLAVADAVGFERFHLVGHDWGAAVGWVVVMNHPERISTWSALSIPHIAAFGAALANDPEQRRRSRYMTFFRVPWLPQQVLAFNDFELLRNLYADHAPTQRAEYLAALSEPGALSAALNWYRAGGDEQIIANPRVAAPVLFVWGSHDPAVGRQAVAGQRDYLAGRYAELELDAGHWLMATHADLVTAAVLAHLEGNRR